MAKITTLKVQEMKDKGEKISMTTAYDYAMASVVDKAGVMLSLPTTSFRWSASLATMRGATTGRVTWTRPCATSSAP